jgi:hypothetical protein
MALISCEKDEVTPSILDILESAQNIEIVSSEDLENGEQLIKFKFKQPLDHNNPNGPYFIQNGSLLHRNYNLPVIFMPSGYGRSYIRHYNLTRYTFSNNKSTGKPNILAVDHRYYGNEGKDFENLDPKYLNIEQAANDLHQVVKTFKKTYNSKWISMGYSKGGHTCTYHKYFFPNDIDGTLSFVAPLTLQEADDRFYEFIKNIHTPTEYDKMLNFQRLLLIKRDDLTPLLEDWYRNNNLEMDRESDKVIEGIALSYPFTYWQYKSYWASNNSPILNAPTIEDSAHDIFEFLSTTYFLDNYSTKDVTKYKPYSYQVKTQLGYPIYAEYEQLSDLLKYYKTPRNKSLDFDPQPILDVVKWLDESGDNIVHLYGSKDPWTAAMYNNAPYRDALTLMNKGGDHLVDLFSFNDNNYAISKLQQWTGFKIEYIWDYEVTTKNATNIKDWIKEESSTPFISDN